MTRFVEVAVNIPQVSGVFHYHLPIEMEGQVEKGCLVVVPFGKRTAQGVVVDFVERPSVSDTRPVLDLVDPAAVITHQQIAFARVLAEEALSTLAECIGLMLPPGLEQQTDMLYLAGRHAPGELTHTQKRLLGLLDERGELRGRQIDRHFRYVDWRPAARALIQRGLIIAKPVLPEPKVHPKMVRTVALACPPEVALQALPTLAKAGSKALSRRQAMLRFIVQGAGPVEVAWVYAAASEATTTSGGMSSVGNLDDLRSLEARGLVRLGESESLRDPLSGQNFLPNLPPLLTADQKAVWQEVQRQIRQSVQEKPSRPILLYGVTGSGKTEIYLQAVQAILEMGRQAIVLVPEIALTPQTIQRFAGRFPGRVGLIHSGLSAGERYDTWRRARAGELGLVVGPRSALFTPFEKLGLIVVDECHDDSYYQSEAPPHYHAREAAVRLADLSGAVCLLGSATPDVSSMYHCQRGEWELLQLPARILAHQQAVQMQVRRLEAEGKLKDNSRLNYTSLEGQAEALELPPVGVVDMRQELQAGNRSIFSRELQTALAEVLSRGLQAILFLNRRGTSTYVFCRDCGYSMKCPRCDTPLTYHEKRGELMCHYCGYHRHMPNSCPACGSQRIRQYGTGTQRVEAEVQALFPQARPLRWDYETTRKKGAHDAILSHFASHHSDVLIGTQMLAKGLDLPLVTLVGVILADVGLNMPDYRAGERAFQVLTQVAGRAGRSPLGGRVILQTFQPEHYVIQAAAGHDYQAFYQRELAYRRQTGYPPFTRLVRLEYRHYDNERAERLASEMAERLKTWLEQEGRAPGEGGDSIRLIGPAPCFFARMAGVYRWQIALCGSDPVSFLRGRELRDWHIEVNPPSLL